MKVPSPQICTGEEQSAAGTGRRVAEPCTVWQVGSALAWVLQRISAAATSRYDDSSRARGPGPWMNAGCISLLFVFPQPLVAGQPAGQHSSLYVTTQCRACVARARL